MRIAAGLVLLVIVGAASAVSLHDQLGAISRTRAGSAAGAKKPMRCGFVRGWGGTVDFPSPRRATDPHFAVNSDADTWGQLHVIAKPYCTGLMKFYTTETQKRGWDDHGLQQEYCDFIDAWDLDVVFSHSLGNLIIAAGVQRQLSGCRTIGKESHQRHWYGVNAPLRGTEAANIADKICLKTSLLNSFLPDKLCRRDGFNVVINGGGILGGGGIINNGGINGGGWIPTKAIKSLQTSSVPPSLADTATRLMSGSLCGVSPANGAAKLSPPPVGPTTNSRAAIAVAFNAAAATVAVSYPNVPDWRTVVPPGLPSVLPYGNDGVVPFKSCRVAPLSSYSKSPSARHYALDGSHWDGPCQFGDSSNLSGFRPCRWITNMIAYSQQLKSRGSSGGLILPTKTNV